MAKTAARPTGTTERSGRADVKNKTRWGTAHYCRRKADFLIEQQGLLLFLLPVTRKAQKWTLSLIGYEPLDGRFCVGNCYRLFTHIFNAIEHEGWTISAITTDN